MKNLFIITSSIMTGVGDPEERFFQTLHTIDSIRSRVNDVEIWVCDSAPIRATPTMIKKIEIPDIVKFLDFSKDDRVIKIRTEVESFKIPAIDEIKPFYRLGFIKNLTESYVLNQVLRKIEVDKYQRIFKISGRYFLNNSFNLESHLIPNKMVLLSSEKSPLGQTYISSDYYRHCVAWSFCPNIHSEIKEIFSVIENYLINQTKKGLLGDIEHGLYLYAPKNLIVELPEYGVIGRVNNKKSGYF